MRIIRAEWVCPWCFRIRGPWHGLLVKRGICLPRASEEMRFPFDQAGRECPRCEREIPEDDDCQEGPVWLRADGKAYCSMRCALARHEELLEGRSEIPEEG